MGTEMVGPKWFGTEMVGPKWFGTEMVGPKWWDRNGGTEMAGPKRHVTCACRSNVRALSS